MSQHGEIEQCLRFVPGSRLVADPESIDLSERLSAACRTWGADAHIVDEVDDLWAEWVSDIDEPTGNERSLEDIDRLMDEVLAITDHA